MVLPSGLAESDGVRGHRRRRRLGGVIAAGGAASLALCLGLRPGLATEDSYSWLDLEPANGEIILTDVVEDPGDPSRIFALGRGAVYASYRSGNGWRAVSPPGRTLHALAVDPASPGLLFGTAAPGTPGVQVSRDGGVTWASDPSRSILTIDGRSQVRVTEQWGGLRESYLHATDPVDPGILYSAKGSEGVVATSDAAKPPPWAFEPRSSWLEKTGVVDLLVDPENPQRLLALASDPRYSGSGFESSKQVFESLNGGRMWKAWPRGRLSRLIAVRGPWVVGLDAEGTVLSLEGEKWSKVARCRSVSALGGGRFACSNEGTVGFLRLDQGKVASEGRTTGLSAPDVERIRELGSGALVALPNAEGALTTGDGSSWAGSADFPHGREDRGRVVNGVVTRYLATRPLGRVRDVVSDSAQSGALVAAIEDHVAVRRAPGDPWTRRKEEIALVLQPDPASPAGVFAGTPDGQVMQSPDLGWNFTSERIAAKDVAITDLRPDPSGTGVLWAATWGAGLVRRGPDGHWLPAGGRGPGTYVRRLGIDPVDPAIVWAAAWTGGLWRTMDGGASWERIEVGCRIVYDVAVHPLTPEQVVAGCEDGKVARTWDKGGHWDPVPLDLKGDVIALHYWTSRGAALVVGTTWSEIAVVGTDGKVVVNRDEADLAVLSPGQRRARERRATEAAERARAEAEAEAKREKEQAAIRRSAVDLVAFSTDGQRGARASGDEVYWTEDAGRTWAELPRWDSPFGREITGLDVTEDGRTLFLWAKGTGLLSRNDLESAPWKQERPARGYPTPDSAGWTPVGGPAVDLGSCKASPDRRAVVRLAALGGALFVAIPSQHAYWYSPTAAGDSPWFGQGLGCERGGDARRLPPKNDALWPRLLAAVGASVPGDVLKALKKAKLEAASTFPLAGGRSLVVTRTLTFVVVGPDGAHETGSVPKGATYVYASKADPLRIYVGMPNGLLVSSDLGASFEPL